MYIINIEGFDFLKTSDVIALGYENFDSAGDDVIVSPGRNGYGSALNLGSTASPGIVFPETQHIRTGVAVTTLDGPNPSLSQIILGFGGIIDGNNASLLRLGRTKTDGFLALWTGSSLIGDIRYTSNLKILANTEYHFEVDYEVLAGDNIVTVRVNGSEVFTFTFTDPSFETTAINRVRLGGSALSTSNDSGLRGEYDDWFIVGIDSPSDPFLGDCRVITRRPTADAGVELTPLSGTDNYAMVNETAGSDDDVTYNSSGTVGDQDLYTSTDTLPGTPSVIWGTGVRVFARKEGAEALTVSTMQANGAVEEALGNMLLANTYLGATHFTQSPPGTTDFWSVSQIEGVGNKFGARIDAA